MSLAVVLVLRDAGDGLRRICQGLAAALAPGDRLVAVDGGSRDATAQGLRRFTADPGWGAGVAAEVIGLPEDTPPDPWLWVAAGRARVEAGHVLCLRGSDLPAPEGFAALRACLVAAPDLVLAARGHWLAGPRSCLPAPDAGRWPAATPADPAAARAAALALAPDPWRLVFSQDLAARGGFARPADTGIAAAWAQWEAALGAASSLAFCPVPVAHGALPGAAGGEVPALLRPMLIEPALAERALQRLDDHLALLDAAGVPACLDTLAGLLGTLPRRARRRAAGWGGVSGPVLAALAARRRDAAQAALLLLLAARDATRQRALSAEIAGLRADLDLALPGPEYLAWLRERARLV